MTESDDTTAGIDNLFIRVNGTGHAFGRELGCDCPRCRTINFAMRRPTGRIESFAGWDDPPWRANQSASVLVADEEGRAARHILIDAGPGVGESMAASGIERLDQIEAIFLTHWHADHTHGLNQICESVRRRRRDSFAPIPLYCTEATYEKLVTSHRHIVENRLDFRAVSPSQPLLLGDGSLRFRVTPIPVAHRDVAGSVIYVFEAVVAEQVIQKAVFAWDIDTPEAVVPGMGEAITNIEMLRRHADLLQGADLLMLEANTWQVDASRGRATGHTSAVSSRSYIDLIAAHRVLFCHLSGHEDRNESREPLAGYGWTDGRWHEETERLARQWSEETGQMYHFEAALQGQIIPWR